MAIPGAARWWLLNALLYNVSHFMGKSPLAVVVVEHKVIQRHKRIGADILDTPTPQNRPLNALRSLDIQAIHAFRVVEIAVEEVNQHALAYLPHQQFPEAPHFQDYLVTLLLNSLSFHPLTSCRLERPLILYLK